MKTVRVKFKNKMQEMKSYYHEKRDFSKLLKLKNSSKSKLVSVPSTLLNTSIFLLEVNKNIKPNCMTLKYFQLKFIKYHFKKLYLKQKL